MSSKIESTHLERRAVVYLRQSDPRQMRNHPESTARQYDLKHRAMELGWPADRVEVIDEGVQIHRRQCQAAVLTVAV